MNITRNAAKVTEEKWARHRYNLTTNLGENGERLTGCKEHIELSRKAAAEGMVLLKNNGLLPLEKDTRVSLFGIGSLDFVKGGGGSGAVFSEYTRNLYEGLKLKEPYVSIYEPLSKYYYDYAKPFIDKEPEHLLYIKPLPEIELPKALIYEAAQNSDVAVITISRFSGEATDRLAEKGDFYLTDIEKELIDNVTSVFEHSVVVLNTVGIIETLWIEENPKIDSALLALTAGMEGGLAVADILCGDVNPSGKLNDTYAISYDDYPSASGFNESEDFVNYYEDIYVGYRYFETIPNKKERVVYPFGFGLSYTEFAITKPKMTLNGDNIEISLSVKNVGKASGKEVIQVYFSAPNGLLGKSSVSLAAFKKTRLLKPCEEEELTLSFPIYYMASYDDLGKLKKSAFILEKGEYKIFAGNSCRNLIEADRRYTVSEEFIVAEQLSELCAPNKLKKRMLANGEFEKLPSFPVKEYYFNAEDSEVQNKGIRFLDVAKGKADLDEFIRQLSIEDMVLLMNGVGNEGLGNTCGMGGPRQLGVPHIMTADGPQGLRLNNDAGLPTTAFPAASLIACSWNTDLMFEIGKAGALEAKENGFGIWLTPALNIHRDPLCGRNFEYFSEDPLISGKFAAAKVKGIQSVNIAASAKHFAANGKEINRKYSDSRLSERALREIYLRGFEICVKESDPWTIMTSYNIINGRRCCESYEQLEGILRKEWGFNGMITSDWNTPCDPVNRVIAGNDILMPFVKEHVENLREAIKQGKLKRGHLEKCSKKILEMILKLS